MLNVVNLFPRSHVKDGGNGFPDEFDWLHSPYDENVWYVSDPVNSNNPAEEIIKFDGVLAPNKNFSDVHGLIDDVKRSLVVTVELGSDVSDFGKARSLSAMRHHVNELKRVLREIYSLYDDIERVDKNDIADVIERLSKKESVALDYPGKLKKYFDKHDLQSIPVKWSPDKKSPASVNREEVFFACGINGYSARYCPDCQEVIQSYHDQLEKHHKTKFEQLSIKETSNTFVSDDSFVDRVNVLRRYVNQSSVEGLFRHPIKVDDSDIDNEQIAEITKKLQYNTVKNRTRNVDVNTFLKVMDSAARYIVDYSDALFELHDALVDSQKDYEDKYEPSKHAGAFLRKSTQNHVFKGKTASPFPLDGLNPSPTGKSLLPEHTVNTILRLIEEGKKDKEIAALVGLTRVQIMNLRNNRVYYGRDLDTSGVSLYTAMHSYLPLSCALILLAFTAGRESGVYGLKADCIKETEGQLWIEMYVHKTIRQYERFPAVKLMEKAVSVLERLSRLYREESGDHSIFKFKSPLFDGVTGLRFDETMTRFCRDVVKLDVEQAEAFKFSEHQFRRFFAIMYFYRYEAGNFEALSYHLRHLTYEMTAIYLTEKQQGKILREVMSEKAKRLAKRAAAGDADIGGQFADELIGIFQNQLEIHGEQFENEPEQYASKETDLIIDFPLAKGLCFGRTPRLVERAKCKVEREGRVLVSILSSSEDLCGDCPNFLKVASMQRGEVPQRASEEIFRVGGKLLDAAIKKGVTSND